MICYKDSPPFGKFNRFISDACLEEIAAFIQRQVPDHAHEWGLPWITKDNAAAAGLGFIQLNSTRDLFVSGDTLYFRSVFDCRFPKNAEEDPVDGDGPLLDVAGKILFYPPGTKKYRLELLEVHPDYRYAGDKEYHGIRFPGVRVNQNLYPAFGFNEEQRHKKLEEEAERFLTQFYPQALISVTDVPLRRIAEELMKLHIFTGYRLPEDMDTLGLTVFQRQKITVTDEETGELVLCEFPRGSILVDPDVVWDRGLGSFQFTLAHEMYHWFAHRVHMAFMDIVGRPDDYEKIKGHLESQADGVAARILMPRHAIEAKYREALELAGSEIITVQGATADADTYEMAVASCAAFFHASKTAVKKRLRELGLHKEIRTPAVRARLDIVEMFTQYATDSTFRDLLDSGIYRYLKGYVIRNDPKYIDGGRLTDYAREHPGECIMTFREQYRTAGEGSDHLLFRKDAYFSRRADYDERIKREPELMKKLQDKLMAAKEAFLRSYGKQETFCQFMMPIITDINTKHMGLDVLDEADDGLEEGKLVLNLDKRYRSRYFTQYDFQTGKKIRITEPEVFQTKTLIGYKMFEKIRRNDWNNPELDMVIAICAGYHLDMGTTEEALLRAGYVLIPYVPKHMVYRFLVMHCRDQYEDTGTFNTLLILLGEEEIGTKKAPPKEVMKTKMDKPQADGDHGASSDENAEKKTAEIKSAGKKAPAKQKKS